MSNLLKPTTSSTSNRLDIFEAKNSWVAYLYAILGHFFITLTWSIFKLLSDSNFDSNQVLYFRGLLIFFMNLALIKYLNHDMYPSDRQAQNTLIARFFIQLASPMLQFYAISQLYVSDATVLALTNPIWVQIASAVVYNEKIHRKNLLLTLVSFAGIICVCRPQFIFGAQADDDNLTEDRDGTFPKKNHLLGCIAMLLGAMLLAFSQCLFKGLQGKTQNTVAMQYFYLSNLLAAPLGIIHAEVNDTRLLWEYRNTLIVIVIACFAFLGQTLQSRSLFIEAPSKLAPLQYSRIIYAFIIDLMFFEIKVHTLSVVGFAIILVSLLNIVRNK